jgi:hypothetical protein
MDHNLETPAMAAAGVIPNRGTPAERGTPNLATQALEFVLVSRNAVVTRPGFYSRLDRCCCLRKPNSDSRSQVHLPERRQRAWSLEKQPCDFLPADDERMMSMTWASRLVFLSRSWIPLSIVRNRGLGDGKSHCSRERVIFQFLMRAQRLLSIFVGLLLLLLLA